MPGVFEFGALGFEWVQGLGLWFSQGIGLQVWGLGLSIEGLGTE